MGVFEPRYANAHHPVARDKEEYTRDEDLQIDPREVPQMAVQGNQQRMNRCVQAYVYMNAMNSYVCLCAAYMHGHALHIVLDCDFPS